MTFSNPVLRYLALAVGLWLLGGAVWGGSMLLGQAFVLLGGLACVGAIVHGVARARSSRYDLGRLREIHERAEFEEVEDEASPDAEFVVCIHCGDAYHRRYPTCPRCAER